MGKKFGKVALGGGKVENFITYSVRLCGSPLNLLPQNARIYHPNIGFPLEIEHQKVYECIWIPMVIFLDIGLHLESSFLGQKNFKDSITEGPLFKACVAIAGDHIPVCSHVCGTLL